MKITFALRRLFATLAVFGGLAAGGCDHALSPISDDYFDKTMTRHYENGDMNNYDYQQSLKTFPEPAPATDDTTGSTSGKTTGSATTGNPPTMSTRQP